VVQLREQLGFTLESGESFSIPREFFGKHFDGDVAAELRVARPVHLAHPAGPDGLDDLVRAELGAGIECHREGA